MAVGLSQKWAARRTVVYVLDFPSFRVDTNFPQAFRIFQSVCYSQDLRRKSIGHATMRVETLDNSSTFASGIIYSRVPPRVLPRPANPGGWFGIRETRYLKGEVVVSCSSPRCMRRADAGAIFNAHEFDPDRHLVTVVVDIRIPIEGLGVRGSRRRRGRWRVSGLSGGRTSGHRSSGSLGRAPRAFVHAPPIVRKASSICVIASFRFRDSSGVRAAGLDCSILVRT